MIPAVAAAIQFGVVHGIISPLMTYLSSEEDLPAYESEEERIRRGVRLFNQYLDQLNMPRTDLGNDDDNSGPTIEILDDDDHRDSRVA